MAIDYTALFGRMCYFVNGAPLLFGIPALPPDIDRRAAQLGLPVELVLPDLDAFCVPDADLERIHQAVQQAGERN